MTRPDREQAAEALFKAALAKPPEDRPAYLAQATAGDEGIRQEVESLLDHFQAAGTFLEGPPIAGRAAGPAEAEQAGEGRECTVRGRRIGSYEILDLLAEGGMGVVYLVRQDHPPRRVALKLLRPGLATAEMLRRFEHEAEVLGRLQHPGIAQILEAGTAETGFGPQPFFAMEFIEGQRLTEYADAHRLSARQRLELLEKVCDAVQHAHQKGVIHRDLKPANILVNNAGQPKVLDFGVARVTDADVQTITLQTMPGQLLGTVPYMSPEQVAGNPRELDTRSDVYALAVVGYELLTGRLPYDLESRSLTEMVRVIAEETPARLGSVHRTFRGDLETVFRKALDKDKHRRYQSVSAFAADLGCYLRHEPVTARTPSTLYVLGKFARRNKGLAVGAGLAVLSLVAGIVVATAYAVAAKRAEDEARRAEVEAKAQRSLAEQARDQAEATTGFLASMLTAVNPVRLGREVLVKDALDEASRTIGPQFAEQPLVLAYLQHVLGVTYLALGDHALAESHLAKALELRRKHLGETHEDVAMSLNNLANALRQEGDWTQAEAHLRQALSIARASFGDELRVARVHRNLGMVLQAQGKYADAEESYRQALAIQQRLSDEVDAAKTLSHLGDLLVSRGDHAAAESLLGDALAAQRRLLGEEHPDLAVTIKHLGALFQAKGDCTAAEPHLREALAMQRRLLGDEHSDVADTLGHLGNVLDARGDLAGAEPLLRLALDLRRKRLGARHPALAASLKDLSTLLAAKGEYAEAERLLQEASVLGRQDCQEHQPGVALSASRPSSEPRVPVSPGGD